MSQSRKAVQGVKWNYLSIVGMALAQLAFTAVLSRLLSPSAFGLMAMANLMIRFGNYFSAQGIRLYLIQKAELDHADIGSAFWLSAGIGIALALAAFALAPVGAYVFQTSQVEPVIRAMALVYIFTGLSVTSSALLAKSLRFKAISLAELASYLIGYLLLGIPMAWAGMGVYALVGAILARQFLLAISLYALARHTVAFRIQMHKLKGTIMRGSHYSLNAVLDFAVLSLPTLFIGRSFGDVLLGFFNRANQLVTLPTNNLSAAVARVFFPLLASLRGEPDRMRQVYINGTIVFSLLMIPLCLGMVPAAAELITGVLGAKWAPAIPVFQVLCIGMMFQFSAIFPGQYADAHAYLRVRSVVQIATLTVMVVAMLGLRSHGIVGVAAGFAVGQVFRFSLFMWLLGGWIGLRLSDYLGVYGPAVIVGAVAASAVRLVHTYLHTDPVIWTLVAEILVGSIVYAALVFVLPFRQMRNAFVSLLRSFPADNSPGLASRLLGAATRQFSK